MLKPSQCKVGTRVIWKDKSNRVLGVGSIVRYNGVIVFNHWHDNKECVWVQWDNDIRYGDKECVWVKWNEDSRDIRPLALEELELDTPAPQTDEKVTASPTLAEQEREAVMLLLSLGYTITKDR